MGKRTRVGRPRRPGYTSPKGRPTPSRRGTNAETAARHSRRSHIQWALVAAAVVSLIGLLVAFGPGLGGDGQGGRPPAGVHGN